MITVSYPIPEAVAAPFGRSAHAPAASSGASGGLRIALCCFAPPAATSQAERMQATLALRFMQQQLAGLGAEVALLPAVHGDYTQPAQLGHGIDALVVFPAFCPSPSALAAVLDAADRPGLVMALSTGCGDDGDELEPLFDQAQGGTSADVTAMGRMWIGGGLFDVRAWFEAGQWIAALHACATLARGRFGMPVETNANAVRDPGARRPN